jgi:ribonuclease HI
MPAQAVTAVLVHADESCLVNRRDEPSPGGNAALIEAPAGDSIARWDFYECAPATTNNRMALAGAIATLEWTHRQWQGVTEWLPGWKSRGWKRKGGEIENLLLWQKLDQARQGLTMEWQWVRGHSDVAKNEYADFLAVRAAELQQRSNGLVPSGFDTWLAQQRARGKYGSYDPDGEVHERA